MGSQKQEMGSLACHTFFPYSLESSDRRAMYFSPPTKKPEDCTSFSSSLEVGLKELTMILISSGVTCYIPLLILFICLHSGKFPSFAMVPWYEEGGLVGTVLRNRLTSPKHLCLGHRRWRPCRHGRNQRGYRKTVRRYSFPVLGMRWRGKAVKFGWF